MPLFPVTCPPGICLSQTPYGIGKTFPNNRWSAGMNIEFIAGSAQKIAGWQSATSSPMNGTPREVQAWRDNSGLARIITGTTEGLYQWQPGSSTVPTDITPLRTLTGGSLTNPITTAVGNPLINIADNTQQLANGDWVFLGATSAVGGVTINGWYQVANRTATGYQISSLVTPSATAGPGGGIVNFQYPRLTLSNPFTTTAGSPIVTVHDVTGPAVVGGFVVYSGGSPVGGLTLNGTYQIVNVLGGSNYTIQASSAATVGVTGGGSVSVVYEIMVAQSVNSSLLSVVWGQAGITWGQSGLNWGTNGFISATLSDGWTLAAYGTQMLAAPVGGTIYVYDPAYGGRAYPLLNAPLSMNAMFVTPERFVVALGINGNLLKIGWADQTDYTQWTTTPTNTANTGRTFVGGSYFVGGIPVRDGVSLIATNTTIFQLNYTGGQEIYSSPQIGDNCGWVSPSCAVEAGGIVWWMSDEDWWSWNGGVVVLQSDDVRDSVYRTGINRTQMGKCTAQLNRAKRQVRFFYPDANSSENSLGMIYQYDQNCWAPLGFGRTCGTDAELLPNPISSDTSALILYDETGVDADTLPLGYYLMIGTSDVSNGDRNVDMFGLITDFQALNGNCYFNALAAYYPSDPLQTDGPFTLTSSSERIDLRLDGKLFAFSIQSNDLGATMRLGVFRLDIQPSGARR